MSNSPSALFVVCFFSFWQIHYSQNMSVVGWDKDRESVNITIQKHKNGTTIPEDFFHFYGRWQPVIRSITVYESDVRKIMPLVHGEETEMMHFPNRWVLKWWQNINHSLMLKRDPFSLSNLSHTLICASLYTQYSFCVRFWKMFRSECDPRHSAE